MTDQARYQLFPDLADDDYAALKKDIAEHGIQVAVEYDDEGEILDGHHRVRAWTELAYEGVPLDPYPRVIRDGMTEAQKRAHVRRLNILRRHLTQEQKRELIRDQVRETPERSNRQIAGTLGVSHHTVENVRENLESSGQIAQIDERTVERGDQTYTQQTANIGRMPAARRAPDPEFGDDYVDDVPARPVDEPIEDVDGQAYETLPLSDAPAAEPTIGDLVEGAFTVPPRGLDPHSKAWHAAVAPAMFQRLDPAAVIATREPREIERGVERMAETVAYVTRLMEAGRSALGRSRLEVVR